LAEAGSEVAASVAVAAASAVAALGMELWGDVWVAADGGSPSRSACSTSLSLPKTTAPASHNCTTEVEESALEWAVR